MGFTVVQWENKKSVSGINEKQVDGTVELKEGTTVHISTGRYKGRAAVYKATILKVCAFRSNWFHFIPRRRYHAPEALAEDNYGKQIRDVRQPLSQVRLSLSVSLGAGQIIFLVGINATENMAACITAAALLQYFLMAAFCWMLVEGIYLYLFVVKAFLSSWWPFHWASFLEKMDSKATPVRNTKKIISFCQGL